MEEIKRVQTQWKILKIALKNLKIADVEHLSQCVTELEQQAMVFEDELCDLVLKVSVRETRIETV